MVIHTSNLTTVSDIDKKLMQKSSHNKQIPSNMGVPFDAKKFEGMMQKGIDGVTFQKNARNEWN
ncbi:MAG: hypothetical protein EAZ53_09370 [Bacteroidetes bacterium]|nr:MAG: hypothetical protein EAZ53_09370 [Bacteroidota bacterium]